MQPIIITVGKSRRSTHWKPASLDWGELTKLLKEPIRTEESQEEYQKLEKAEQAKIKDVGGFVAGTLDGHRRTAKAVLRRFLVTLDLDYLNPKEDGLGGLESVTGALKAHNLSFFLHSTRSHTKAAPRYRLIIPLKDSVTAEQYEPVARKVAEQLGLLGVVDPTTFEASRLMYWPSVSRDQTYYRIEGEGEEIDPLEMLNAYEDWKDATTWPLATNHETVIRAKVKDKADDPLTKQGAVGAFCRAFSIEEAIERFLPEVFLPTQDPARYTYYQSSTTGGAVVYDHKFLYSHHATDPHAGRVLNAFDLVRLHRFDASGGEEDTGTRSNSYQEMLKLITQDETAKQQILEERYQKGIEALEVFEAEADPEDQEWLSELAMSGKGAVSSTIHNVFIICQKDPALADSVRFNEFSGRFEIIRNLPWDAESVGRNWEDRDEAGLRHYLEHVYGIQSVSKIADGFTGAANLNRYNPVKDWILSKPWDGVKRIETALIDYLAAEDSAYTRAVSKKLFTAGAARILRPGVKFDNMVILGGKQGTGKSTFVRKLGRELWFTDCVHTFTGKEASEALQGFWVIEIGELHTLNRSEINAAKLFLSRQEDSYRPAYGRFSQTHKRSCIFIGTTNNEEYLKDLTGNRRFWPVDVDPENAKLSIFDDLDEETVQQLWAEGAQAFLAGEPLHLTGEAAKQAEEQQQKHMERSHLEGVIEEYLNKPIVTGWYSLPLYDRRAILAGDYPAGVAQVPRDRVCVAAIWEECLGGDLRRLQRRDAEEIRKAISTLNTWQPLKHPSRFGVYGKQRAFQRG